MNYSRKTFYNIEHWCQNYKWFSSTLTKRLSKRERLSVANLSIPSCGLYYKSFTIVNYDRNDNGLYYNTTIVANLTMIVANLTMIVANFALVRSVNYDCKVRCKQKCTFTIINYDPKPLIVQATGLILESMAGAYSIGTALHLLILDQLERLSR